MSGHAVPVDAWGGPRCHSPWSNWFVPRSLPPPTPQYSGTQNTSKWGNRVRKREMERREGKNPVPVSRGSFCSLKWLPGGSQGCGHGGGGWWW